MSDAIADVLGFLLILAASSAWTWWRYKYASRDRAGFVARADAEFRQILITGAPAAYCFDGRSAEIVGDYRDYADRYQTTVTCVRRYARNAHGEYFFFLSEGTGKPLFKHIEQNVAKAALGKKYIPPAPLR